MKKLILLYTTIITILLMVSSATALQTTQSNLVNTIVEKDRIVDGTTKQINHISKLDDYGPIVTLIRLILRWITDDFIIPSIAFILAIPCAVYLFVLSLPDFIKALITDFMNDFSQLIRDLKNIFPKPNI